MRESGPEGTPTQRVARAFARIAVLDRPEVWISLRAEADACAAAQAVESRLAAGESLVLAGAIVAVKDNVDVAGMPTTAACPEYAYRPAVSAPAVARMEAAGAIVIGKTNMDQFATGLVGTRSPYGAVRNAIDPRFVAGGSSAGSAVAVALGIADIGIGTDTAGSGRVPAAFNGVVGLKPTRGVVPTTGVVPACADFDCVSVLAADVGTAALALRVMAGPDPADPRSRPWPLDRNLSAPAAPHVAVPRPADLGPLSPSYRQAFDRAVETAMARGFSLEEIDISGLLDVARLLYDGALVAQRYAAVGDFLATAPASADPTVSAIILAGGKVVATDYLADLETVLTARRRVGELLGGCDALLVPTTTEHPSISAVADDPLEINRRLGTYTNFCNLLDLASVAVPAGWAGDLPFGISFVVPAFADQVAVDLAVRYLAAPPVEPLVDGIDLAVFGAHLRGHPLNAELVSLGARFIEEVVTADRYRMVALDTVPPKPAVVPVGAGDGFHLTGELWHLSEVALGRLLAGLPAPMALTRVTLADRRQVVGFTCTADAALSGTDISGYGGWAAYQRALVAGVLDGRAS